MQDSGAPVCIQSPYLLDGERGEKFLTTIRGAREEVFPRTSYVFARKLADNRSATHDLLDEAAPPADTFAAPTAFDDEVARAVVGCTRRVDRRVMARGMLTFRELRVVTCAGEVQRVAELVAANRGPVGAVRVAVKPEAPHARLFIRNALSFFGRIAM